MVKFFIVAALTLAPLNAYANCVELDGRPCTPYDTVSSETAEEAAARHNADILRYHAEIYARAKVDCYLANAGAPAICDVQEQLENIQKNLDNR